MSLANGKKKRISDFVLLGMLFFVCAIGGSSPIQAQDDSAYIELVRILDPDFIMPHATGLAYSPTADVFLVLDGEESNNLTMISPFDDWMGSDTLPSIAHPTNRAFDSTW